MIVITTPCMAEPKKHLAPATMRQVFARYRRFREELFPARRELFTHLKDRQDPDILFITCSDSRIAPDLVIGSEPGDLFVCRNAGNIIPAYGEMMGGVSATIEYAVTVLKVNAIVVCGHSDCGAMKALLEPESIAGLPTVTSWLHHAEAARRIVAEGPADRSREDRLEELIEENVLAQLEHLETHPCVVSRLRRGDLELYGWVYRIQTGEILAYDAVKSRFVPLDESMPVATSTRRRRA
jgi:carbonic anhydrase